MRQIGEIIPEALAHIELNKAHLLDNREGLMMLPEKCANLIIADPPYFEVKGDFDFVWKSFDEYLEFMEGQAKLYKRVLADNGTLFVWGNSKKIAYIQVIFDKYFNLENSLVWRKVDSMQYQYYSVELSRCFNTHNERLLMYSNEWDIDSLGKIHSDPTLFRPIKDYMRNERLKCGLSASQLKEKTGLPCNLKLIGMYFGDVQWQLPVRDNYLMMQSTGYWQKPFEEIRSEYDELRAQYEGLREGYESKRRYFNNTIKLEEVLEFSQEGHITKNYDHDTKKPEKLTRALILTCSRPNDLVVIPFAGSGTEAAMAAKEGRRFAAFDIEKEYVEMTNKRVALIKSQPQLF